MSGANNQTLYGRIFVPFGTAVLVTAVAAWLAASVLLGQSLERDLEGRLNYTLDLVANKSLPLTPELLRRVGQLHEAELSLVDEQGQVTFTTLATHAKRDHWLAELWSSGPVGEVFTTEYQNALFLGIRRPLDPASSNGNTGILMLSSLQGVRDAARNAALGIAAITLLVIGVMAWWGHRVSRSITEPIGALAQMATNIAEGDRQVRVQESPIAELAILTRTLNSMADRLQTYEDQLATQNRLAALGEMAERVAHEIRNPITAIKLQMQMLAERLMGNELQQAPKALLVEIERLDLVVSNTLALGRPVQIQRAWGQVEDVLQAVVSLMQPSLEHRGIELQLPRNAELPALSLDKDRFKQVAYNLITNAADALDGGGVLRISLQVNGPENMLEIRFEDSGPGFTQQAKVNFEQRISQSGKPNGSGVGLLLSLELIELHEGTLQLGSSDTLGGGSVLVKLPLLVDA